MRRVQEQAPSCDALGLLSRAPLLHVDRTVLGLFRRRAYPEEATMTQTRRGFLGALLGAACSVLGAAYGWQPEFADATATGPFRMFTTSPIRMLDFYAQGCPYEWLGLKP